MSQKNGTTPGGPALFSHLGLACPGGKHNYLANVRESQSNPSYNPSP
eukprot:CAMPEP_0204469046 /NCGR_PEP_ID=MMETSP0471-20130131/12729_1 /ASSEMBLY_ACC=CAM_ASM_000602 /TAXON_ID=2969 /ORGANISM="Oxyrrhis marina" /LENGTH=46 /DNA_ID= /DNA_START= /DNA_END= /DNA_ORIENTATION=